MSKKQQLHIDDAYAVKSPADNVRLYGQWASTYDTDLIDRIGYVVYLRVAETLLSQRSQIDGAVLDVGCGTGLVGASLRNGGIEIIDGIDISTEMLTEAGKKKTEDGAPVYRNLIAADLTESIDIPDNQYAALISAGTFTHGHLGPESLNELWRVAASGAICAIGVRSTHYEDMGFSEKLSDDVANEIITKPDLKEVKVYSAETDESTHADDQYLIVQCQIV